MQHEAEHRGEIGMLRVLVVQSRQGRGSAERREDVLRRRFRRQSLRVASIQLLQHRRERRDPGRGVWFQPDLKVRDAGDGVGAQSGSDFRWAAAQWHHFQRGGRIRANLDEDAHRAREGRRVAAGLAAGGVDALARAAAGRRRVPRLREPGVPGVGVARRQAEHARRGRADQDGWPLGARAARPQLAVARLVVLAREVDLPVAEQASG